MAAYTSSLCNSRNKNRNDDYNSAVRSSPPMTTYRAAFMGIQPCVKAETASHKPIFTTDKFANNKNLKSYQNRYYNVDNDVDRHNNCKNDYGFPKNNAGGGTSTHRHINESGHFNRGTCNQIQNGLSKSPYNNNSNADNGEDVLYNVHDMHANPTTSVLFIPKVHSHSPRATTYDDIYTQQRYSDGCTNNNMHTNNNLASNHHHHRRHCHHDGRDTNIGNNVNDINHSSPPLTSTFGAAHLQSRPCSPILTQNNNYHLSSSPIHLPLQSKRSSPTGHNMDVPPPTIQPLSSASGCCVHPTTNDELLLPDHARGSIKNGSGKYEYDHGYASPLNNGVPHDFSCDRVTHIDVRRYPDFAEYVKQRDQNSSTGYEAYPASHMPPFPPSRYGGYEPSPPHSPNLHGHPDTYSYCPDIPDGTSNENRDAHSILHLLPAAGVTHAIKVEGNKGGKRLAYFKGCNSMQMRDLLTDGNTDPNYKRSPKIVFSGDYKKEGCERRQKTLYNALEDTRKNHEYAVLLKYRNRYSSGLKGYFPPNQKLENYPHEERPF